MGSVQLLLGKTRARRRRAIPAEHLSGVDPFGRPTFVYVTDSWQKKAVVEREFVARRAAGAVRGDGRPCFSPSIRVLSELFEWLHQRHGDGRALISDRLRRLAAEEVLSENRDRLPWLDRLARGRLGPVAEAIADLHRRSAEARRDLGAIPHADELAFALDALDRKLSVLHGQTPPEVAFESLLDRLASPPPALVQWLRSAHSVVIDDILHASPLRTALLARLCCAWATAVTHVVVAFESGQGLGGREAGLFFEYDELTGTSGAMKPFAATRGLRRALFDELVAQGGDTRIAVALWDRVVDAEHGDGVEEPPDLIDRVYDRGSEPIRVNDPRELLGDRIRLLRAEDPLAEIEMIARAVRLELARGASPSDCVVALAGLDAKGPLVRAVFRDHAIPFSLQTGLPLVHSPVAAFVRNLLAVVEEDLGPESLLALWAHDLVTKQDGLDPMRILQACRAAGIRTGSPIDWVSLLESTSPPIGPDVLSRLDEATGPLRALRGPHPAREWVMKLRAAVTALGVEHRLSDCDDDRVTSENLVAWGALESVLDELERDLAALAGRAWTLRSFADALHGELSKARWRPDPVGPGRVAVVPALDIRGLTPRHTWLGGLSRGSFPSPRPRSFLVPHALHNKLGGPEPLAEARYVFTSLLRNAIATREMHSVTVSWPATDGGRPTAPSPVLADLLTVPLRFPDGTIALLGDRLTEDHTRESEQSAPALSQTERTRRKAREEKPGTDLLARQQAAHAARAEPAFDRWDGIVAAPAIPRRLRVTALETYLRCPARFWYAEVLALAPDEDWRPEIPANRRGSAIHRILEQFYRERGNAPLQGLDDEARATAAAHLAAVAAAVFDELAAEGGFDSVDFDAERHRWTTGLVVKPSTPGRRTPAGVLRAWFDSECELDAPFRPLALESDIGEMPCGPVTLRGRIDRVDRVAGGLVVTDYKTGSAPSQRQLTRGLALQPIVYAEAARARYGPDLAVVSVYQELARPDAVARVRWAGDARLLEALRIRRGLELDSAARERLLTHAAEAARRLLAGIFHPTLAEGDEAGCSYCPFRRICRVDRARAARIGPGDWQAPLVEERPCD